MAAKKGKLPCFDCNQLGHWAGDPECQHPGAGLGRKGPKKHEHGAPTFRECGK